MTPGRKDSLRLFRVAGIDVYLHWAWLLVAFYQISVRSHQYRSLAWVVAEYLTLFLIVLLHEFGHALACRQVGGRADQIMLWPLGGVAYVAPPQRPGAVLWSIAAGPLVNVALFVPFSAMLLLSGASHWAATAPDLGHFILNVWVINFALLVFNILPIYPLDGGQIVRALLWFAVGRARSLFDTAILGFVGVAFLALLAFKDQSIWMGLITFYVFLQCRKGLAQARALIALDRLPRRTEVLCPSCGAPPPMGPVWLCPKCRKPFDPFENNCTCPACQSHESEVQCLTCRKNIPFGEWRTAPPAPVES